jgi:predicted outer membrane repeat protein
MSTSNEGGAPGEDEAVIWYVDERALPNGDGTSWSTAFTHPQQGVDAAGPNEVVKVAEGTYGPWEGNEGYAVLDMKNEVELYGGYYVVGGEFIERDPLSHLTMLIGGGEMAGGLESKHVVLGASYSILDGFYIEDGVGVAEAESGADYSSPEVNADPWGRGMFNESVQRMIIRNCSFDSNTAEAGGGAICSVDSRIYIQRCQFWYNQAFRLNDSEGDPPYYGGAIVVWGGSLEVVNTLFLASYAGNTTLTALEGWGGAIATRMGGDVIMANCTCSGGYADYGRMLYDDPDDDGEIEVRSSILWYGETESPRCIAPDSFDNISYSNVQLSFDQSPYSDPNTISVDPEFYIVNGGPFNWEGFRIPEFHDCVNAVPVVMAPRLDFTGFPRNGADGLVQMGALEEPYFPAYD